MNHSIIFILLISSTTALLSPSRLAPHSSTLVKAQGAPWTAPVQTSLSPSVSTRTSLKSTAGWIITSVVGGASGAPIVSKATRGKCAWYRKINLPEWTPPDKVFAPVWTTLYALMGYAAAKVYQSTGLSPSIKLALFHFVLNISWAPIFFGMQKLRLGHVINLALISTLTGIIPMFYKINPLSAYLLLPYFAWLLFATKLNDSICKLNPTVQGYNNAMLEVGICKLQADAAAEVGL